VARDPQEIAATLRALACLDLVELGQQAVLERIVPAAATCCASTAGVGLLLFNPDQQLCCVAAAGRPRRSLAGSQLRLGESPSRGGPASHRWPCAWVQPQLDQRREHHGCSGHPNHRATGAVRCPRATRRPPTVVLGRAAPGGRPQLLDRHHPPRWPPALSTRVGVWLADGFWFSTGSLARHNLAANPQITLHLESGDQVVILKGVAAAVTGAGRLQAFLAAYNPKYDWDAVVTDDEVTDSAGAAGPAYRVRPRVVFGWDADMRAPTRWSFADPTTSVTP
jgi:hypothetical protein